MIIPVRDTLVVKKQDSGVDKTPGGLFMPVMEEKLTRGEVVAVKLVVGDVVLFNKTLGTEVRDGDQNYFVIREDNVVCKVG